MAVSRGNTTYFLVVSAAAGLAVVSAAAGAAAAVSTGVVAGTTTEVVSVAGVSSAFFSPSLQAVKEAAISAIANNFFICLFLF